MAQFKIIQHSGMTSGAWSAVRSPFAGARVVTISNPSGGGTITICTDTADSNSVITLDADTQFTIQMSPTAKGFGLNEVVCYVKGAGSAPIILAAK